MRMPTKAFLLCFLMITCTVGLESSSVTSCGAQTCGSFSDDYFFSLHSITEPVQGNLLGNISVARSFYLSIDLEVHSKESIPDDSYPNILYVGIDPDERWPAVFVQKANPTHFALRLDNGQSSGSQDSSSADIQFDTLQKLEFFYCYDEFEWHLNGVVVAQYSREIIPRDGVFPIYASSPSRGASHSTIYNITIRPCFPAAEDYSNEPSTDPTANPSAEPTDPSNDVSTSVVLNDTTIETTAATEVTEPPTGSVAPTGAPVDQPTASPVGSDADGIGSSASKDDEEDNVFLYVLIGVLLFVVVCLIGVVIVVVMRLTSTVSKQRETIAQLEKKYEVYQNEKQATQDIVGTAATLATAATHLQTNGSVDLDNIDKYVIAPSMKAGQKSSEEEMEGAKEGNEGGGREGVAAGAQVTGYAMYHGKKEEEQRIDDQQENENVEMDRNELQMEMAISSVQSGAYFEQGLQDPMSVEDAMLDDIVEHMETSR